MSDSARARQQLMGWLWLALVCFFNTIPLLIISLLANLSSVAQYVPFLEDWQKTSEWSFALVNGILPPTISAIFGWILPKIMRWLSEYQGAITQTRLDRAVVQRYFAFLIISQLLIFSLLGVLIQLATDTYLKIEERKSFMEIITNIKVDPESIQSSFISLAPYWLTYFPYVFKFLRCLFILTLSGQASRILGHLRSCSVDQPRLHLDQNSTIRSHTSRHSRVDSATRVRVRDLLVSAPAVCDSSGCSSDAPSANLLFMVAVGLVYAPLAPLVALAAAMVFWISSVVYKYQLMFVFITKVESGGVSEPY